MLKDYLNETRDIFASIEDLRTLQRDMPIIASIIEDVMKYENQIRKDINEANSLKEEADKKLKEYNKIIDEAKLEAKKLISEGRKKINEDIQSKKEQIEKDIQKETLLFSIS